MPPFRLVKLRQRFDRTRLDDPVIVLRQQLRRLDDLVRKRARIAIATGSRGIDNLVPIVQEVIAYVKARGAQPFIVPAMGSHGGATGAGQAAILREYGIFEDAIGAPVVSSMDVVELPRGDLSFRLYMDRHAFESDGVILVNRIKPHTDFHGSYESGLMKMALIGLGKLEGAQAIHLFGVRGLRELIGPGATQVLASGRILAGIGLVENALHQTLHVRVLKSGEIAGEEPVLLDIARRNMPHLPINEVDVLLIDRMGKNISGVGIDPNVTGRIGVNGEPDAESPKVAAMVVCDLTDQSHGNAIGVGLADVITRHLHAKIDQEATYANVLTSGFLERGKIPIIAETARAAFEIAVRSCGRGSEGDVRVLRILDTLNIEELYASQAVVDELGTRLRPVIISGASDLFDERGDLTAF